MAENFDLIFGQSAGSQYAWNDSDYQNGWKTVGSTPPTAEQFDALQRRSDTKAKNLNDRLSPLETKAEADGRQAATEYAEGVMVTADGLPNGWLLECVVPGTTGAGALVIPSPLVIGGTIVDGTVTWTVRKNMNSAQLGYRQPNETVTAGTIRYHQSLPVGWYLECTTAGITSSSALVISSPAIGGTVSDGTVTWTVCKDIGTGNAPIYAGFNQKQTFTSSGSFTAPVTGTYKITMQGGGGGGAGGSYHTFIGSGGGGGEGAKIVTYEKLVAGQSYTYTIGAGGAGGAGTTTSIIDTSGNVGGDTSITVNSNVYVAGGGSQGHGAYIYTCSGGSGGSGKINDVIISKGAAGENGVFNTSQQLGGIGGGASGFLGGGGNGGLAASGRADYGNSGSDGYITFEWLDASLL